MQRVSNLLWILTSGQTKKKAVWGYTEAPRDFNTVYYMGVNNRSGGNPSFPPVI